MANELDECAVGAGLDRTRFLLMEVQSLRWGVDPEPRAILGTTTKSKGNSDLSIRPREASLRSVNTVVMRVTHVNCTLTTDVLC